MLPGVHDPSCSWVNTIPGSPVIVPTGTPSEISTKVIVSKTVGPTVVST